MPYRFATAASDYSDYAGGRVFYGAPGYPALPVRLASEVLQRCLAIRGATSPAVLYDPCCGGAYHLGTLAYLHWQRIGAIAGSDVDAEALALPRPGKCWRRCAPSWPRAPSPPSSATRGKGSPTRPTPAWSAFAWAGARSSC